MSDPSNSEPGASPSKRKRPRRPAASRKPVETRLVPVSPVMERARDMGLMGVVTRQVGARLPSKLLEQAKSRTGIASTTDLLAFALASVTLEDDFAKAFVEARGTLDPDLDLGF